MKKLVDLYSTKHEYIFFGCELSFVFSWILWLHAFFVFFEYIQIFIFNLHSMAVHALIEPNPTSLRLIPIKGDHSPKSPFLGATSAKSPKMESKTTLHLVSH